MSRSTILAITLLFSLTTSLHAQNPSSVELTKTLSGHTKSIQEIVFSPRGELLAASSNGGTVRLWNVASGEPLGTIVGEKNAETAKLSWSDDERRLAITYRLKKSSELVMYEISATRLPEVVHRFPVVDFVEWSSDNRTFLAWDQQMSLKLWDAATGQSTHTLTPQVLKDKLLIAGFVADGLRVLTGSLDGPVELWDAGTGKRIETYAPNTDFYSPSLKNVEVPLFSFDRRFFISGNTQLYDASSGKLLTSIKHATPISFSPDRKTLLTVHYDHVSKSSRKSYLTLRTITDDRKVSTFVIPDGIANIYWSPDGRKIAVVGYDFDTRLIDAATGRENGRPYENCWPWQLCGSDGCEALRFSADGTLLLQDKEPIKLLETESVSLVKELKTAKLPAVFSPAGRLLATRSKDKRSVLLWRF